MKISDIGEFGFIDAIKADTLYHKENVVVGIGDDGAVYTTTPGWQQVAVIDTMVQNSHFIIGQTAQRLCRISHIGLDIALLDRRGACQHGIRKDDEAGTCIGCLLRAFGHALGRHLEIACHRRHLGYGNLHVHHPKKKGPGALRPSPSCSKQRSCQNSSA